MRSLISNVENYLLNNHLPRLERRYGKEKKLPTLVNFSDVKRILVVSHHGHVPEFLLATPVLRALKEHFPEARIGLVVDNKLKYIARNNLFVDEVIVFQMDKGIFGFGEARKFIKKIKDRWDMAISLNVSRHSLMLDIVAAVSGAELIVGSEAMPLSRNTPNVFYNLISPVWRANRHFTERNLDIIRHIGVETDNLYPIMNVTEQDELAARREMEKAGMKTDIPIMGLQLSAPNDQDNWPVSRFASLAQRLVDQHGIQIALFADCGKQELIEKFYTYINFEPVQIDPMPSHVIASYLKNCTGVVSNETDLFYIAAALDIPTICMFSEVNPDVWMPASPKCIAVKAEGQGRTNIKINDVYEKVVQALGLSPATDAGVADFKTGEFDISDDIIKNFNLRREAASQKKIKE